MKMNKVAFRKFRLFSFVCLITFFFVLFNSCSQSLPDVNQTVYSVVFSFKDNNSRPDARLSVFVENKTDVRRCQQLKLTSKNSEYNWETDNIKKISAGDYQWAGNVNFNVPEGEKIPQGIYNLVYVNADEEEDKSSFAVKYNEKFYEATANKVPDLMENIGSLNLAVFDADGILIYFGEKTEELSTKADIFSMYQNAATYKDIWLSYDKTVICILPENKL